MGKPEPLAVRGSACPGSRVREGRSRTIYESRPGTVELITPCGEEVCQCAVRIRSEIEIPGAELDVGKVHQVPGLAANDGVKRAPAHYWLGAGTYNNLVVGQDEVSDRVLDLGTNNIVENALHKQQGKPDDPPGQSLKDDGPLLNLYR